MYCNPGFRKGKLMQGRVLYYIAQTESGVITGDDGKRYTFVASEWKDAVPPTRGMNVDFEIQEGEARAIYRALECCSVVPGALSSKSTKSRMMAAFLAFLLGGLGAHKFYLGYTVPGLVYLLVQVCGFAFCSFAIGDLSELSLIEMSTIIAFMLYGLVSFALMGLAFIEGVIYLTRNDEEFEKTYVIGRKNWF